MSLSGGGDFPRQIFDIIQDQIPINDPAANTVIILGKTPYESSIFVCGKELRGCTGLKITVDPVIGRTLVELEVLPLLVVSVPKGEHVKTNKKKMHNGLLHMVKSFFRSICQDISKRYWKLHYGRNLTQYEWGHAGASEKSNTDVIEKMYYSTNITQGL